SLGRLRRARDRAEARASLLAGDEALGRGADERDPVQLEQEQVGRGVDAAERSVEVERRGRRGPLGALRGHDLERVAGDDVLLAAAHHLLVAAAVWEAAQRAGGAAALAVPGGSRLQPAGDLVWVAGEHLGDAGAVVEADERLADDEAALRKAVSLCR